MDRKRYYTVLEAAQLLGFSDQTIRNWIKIGHIKASRPGLRALRIPASEIERLLRMSESDNSGLMSSDNGDKEDYNRGDSIRTPMPAAA